MVKSFGSSRDEAQIERMVEQAREFIQRQTGTFYHLFNPPPEQDITDFVGSLSNNQISVDGPDVVLASCSTMWVTAPSEDCSDRLY